MELDANLLTLQSILKQTEQATSKFSKINYKTGNEEKIAYIVKTMKMYLESNFPESNNDKYRSQLRNLTLFLLINTKFSDNGLLNVQEYFHLVNVIPLLSKCVLAHIIVQVDLVQYYCLIMPLIPLNVNEQLLSEFKFCLKHLEPTKLLENTYNLLDTVIITLSSVNSIEFNDTVTKIGDVVLEMLKNISGVNYDFIQDWQKSKFNKHIGFTLLYLLKLIRRCPLHSPNISRILDDIIKITIEITAGVTIDIFCSWHEITNESDESLQVTVASEAYFVVKYVQEYKPALKLIEILGSIARKPKTIVEIIQEADLSKIILFINKCDSNQKLWFKALLNTNVFQDESSMKCLNKWAHLCTQNDVNRLFSLSYCQSRPQIQALLLKCAKTLNAEELAAVTARYYVNENQTNDKTTCIKEELTVLLNKAENNCEYDEDFLKDIYLLILQNREFVLTTLYMECLKNSINIYRFKGILKKIKAIVEVNNFSKVTFIKILKDHLPSSETIPCYKEVLHMLLEVYFDDYIVIRDILTPQLQELFDKDDEKLLYMLQICNLLSINYFIQDDTLPMVACLLKILEKKRCQFFTFSNFDQQVVQESVNLILAYMQNTSYLQFKDALEKFQIQNYLNKFYMSKLCGNEDFSLLKFIYPSVDINNHAAIVSKLIKILPSCVTSEWILITKELETYLGYKKLLNLYQDVLILLCEIVKTQQQTENVDISNGLSYCLQQYAIIIKEILQPKYSCIEEQKMLANSICGLLKDVPRDIRKEEGLRLIGLLTSQSLHSLKEDRAFILSLIAIDDIAISQTLAQRMLS